MTIEESGIREAFLRGEPMSRPAKQRFSAAVHGLRRAGLNVEHKSWGFRLYHQDAAGVYVGESRQELDETISLSVVVGAAPARWFFRRSIPEIADLLACSYAQNTAGTAASLAAALDAAETAFDRREMLEQMYAGKGPFAALVVALPEECFPDQDDICSKATTYLSGRLEAHLTKHGHSIPRWIQGGCAEDWGAYLESVKGETRYRYSIMFFPRGRDTRSIAVMYEKKVGFWHSVFRGRPQLAADDPLHRVLWDFGADHERPQMLTQAQMDADAARPHLRD